MNECILARLMPDAPDRLEWFRIDREGGAVGEPTEGTLPELAEQTKRVPLVLLLPGDEVLLTRVILPPGNSRQLSNAVPYAVEDQLAEDVEKLYIVHGPRADDGITPVAVVRRRWIDALLKRLTTAGIRPAWAIPEPLLLPRETGSWSLLEDGDRIILRSGRYSGFSMEREAALPLLRRLLREREDEPPSKIRIRCRQEGGELQELFSFTDCNPETVLFAGSSLSLFQPLPDKRPRLDLLRTVQRSGNGGSSSRQTWLAVAALLLLSLTIYIGSTGYRYWQLVREGEQLTESIHSTFKDAFPEVRRIVDPIVQAERELQKRRRSHGRGGDPFLSLLYGLGQGLQRQSSLKLTGLEYRNGVVEARLDGKNVAQIETLKQLMEKSEGLDVELLSAVSREQGVAAKLRVKRVFP